MKKQKAKKKIELFDFWKENKLDQHFTLTGPEVAKKFSEWLKTKEQSYLEYYGTQGCALAFIGSKEGLNSVMNNEETNELVEDHLRPVFLQALKK